LLSPFANIISDVQPMRRARILNSLQH